ncbi:MAG TPA: DUF5335 family protein [Verrucomicrobiae bacterium]|jgi:hypothetical protein|nr:DUF5335 family protein [Verrucomicrobiae bacterium]
MKTRELKQNEWKNFCGQLGDSQGGGLVTIQLVQADGSTDPVVADVPLQSVAFKENPDACNDTIVMEAGLPNERPHKHLIVEPVRLILRNGSGDRFNQLEIIAESGTTLVTFHPGINPASLDRLSA